MTSFTGIRAALVIILIKFTLYKCACVFVRVHWYARNKLTIATGLITWAYTLHSKEILQNDYYNK